LPAKADCSFTQGREARNVIAPADSCSDDDTLVEFRVDPGAEQGNVILALTRLLIDLAQRQNETSGPAMAARSDLVFPDVASHEGRRCLL
jgi:hypothetical protein